MGFADLLTDVVQLQRGAVVSDLAGGHTITWTTVIRFPCRIVMSSSADVTMEGRAGHQHTGEITAENQIPTTRGHRTLDRLLRDKAQGAFRFLYEKIRTLSYEGHILVALGVHDTLGGAIVMNYFETPEPFGVMDL